MIEGSGWRFVPPEAEELESNGELRVLRAGRRVFVGLGQDLLAQADPEACTVEGYIPDRWRADPWIFLQASVLPLLTMVLRAKGYFALHAAAVNVGDSAVLFPGLTGGGKSTTCFALLRAGFGYLSDEMPLVKREGSRLVALSLSDKISLRMESLDFFPELAPLREQGPDANGKVTFAPGRFHSGCWTPRALPELIVFPTLSGESASRAFPSSKASTLARLIPHSLSLLDPGAVEDQFRLLGDLVEHCSCWELAVGRDLEAMPAVVRELLEGSQRRNESPGVVKGAEQSPPGPGDLRPVLFPTRCPSVLWRMLDGEAVLFHPGSGSFSSLNHVGASVWQLADGSRSLEDVALAISQEYRVDLQRALTDVSGLFDEFRGEGLVTDPNS